MGRRRPCPAAARSPRGTAAMMPAAAPLVLAPSRSRLLWSTRSGGASWPSQRLASTRSHRHSAPRHAPHRHLLNSWLPKHHPPGALCCHRPEACHHLRPLTHCASPTPRAPPLPLLPLPWMRWAGGGAWKARVGQASITFFHWRQAIVPGCCRAVRLWWTSTVLQCLWPLRRHQRRFSRRQSSLRRCQRRLSGHQRPLRRYQRRFFRRPR